MSEQSNITVLASGTELYGVLHNVSALDAGPAIVDIGPERGTYVVTLTLRQAIELARRVADVKLKY